MNFQDYKHMVPVQIRFSDIDKVNHVNNACYHTYIELGRVHYLDQVLQRGVNWQQKGFVLARTEIDHKKQIYLHDEIYCFTKVTAFGKKSMKIKSAVVKKENGQLVECAAAVGILVAMDYIKNESIEVPAEWRERFEKFESA